MWHRMRHKHAPLLPRTHISSQSMRAVDLLCSAASIHPCRHAEVMKRLVDNLLAAGKEFELPQ